MPILTIDGESHYQSGAALRYIGATAGDGSLYPTDDAKARFEIDKMLGLSEDLDRAWRPALYAGMKPQYLGHHSTDVARTKRMREEFLRNELPKCVLPNCSALLSAGFAHRFDDVVQRM